MNERMIFWMFRIYAWLMGKLWKEKKIDDEKMMKGIVKADLDRFLLNPDNKKLLKKLRDSG